MVSRKGRQLQREIDHLVHSSAELRKMLVRYERANRSLASMVERGIPAIEALERIGAEGLRPELSDALERFDDVRRAGRLAIMALALEEGSSISEIARALHFSRQLASRLAAQIDT